MQSSWRRSGIKTGPRQREKQHSRGVHETLTEKFINEDAR